MEKVFFRFYDQTQETINSFKKELLNLAPNIKKIEENDLKKSMNLFVPQPSEGKINIQVDVWFYSRKEAEEFHKKPKLMEIYNDHVRRGTDIIGGTERRNRDDTVNII